MAARPFSVGLSDGGMKKPDSHAGLPGKGPRRQERTPGALNLTQKKRMPPIARVSDLARLPLWATALVETYSPISVTQLVRP